MLLQIHDELVFEVAPGEEEIMKELVKRHMEGVVSWQIPLLVDIHLGKNWQEAKG